MGMNNDCLYGYGFSIYATDEELKNFILKHKETISHLTDGSRLLAYVEECSDEFNLKEDFYDYAPEHSSSEGIYGVIADVITRESGIQFEYHIAQEDQDDAILFPETYPWLLNEKEKSVTEKDLEEICYKYISDLGGELTPEYLRLEFWG